MESCYLNTIILWRKYIKNKIRQNKNLSCAFIDLRRAFDSVKHRKLIEVLAKKSIPRKILILIADNYTGNKTMLQDGNKVKLIQIPTR